MNELYACTLYAFIAGLIIGGCIRHMLQLFLDAQIGKIKNGDQPVSGRNKNGDPPKSE